MAPGRLCHPALGGQSECFFRGWAGLGRAPLKLCVPAQVEFPPKVLQQNPPNGWFRLLPFPRAEEDSG